METVTDFILGVPKSMQMVTSAMKLKDALWKKSYDKPRQHVKKHRHYFANKSLSTQSYGFSNSHEQSVRVEPQLSTEELMLLNCGVTENS